VSIRRQTGVTSATMLFKRTLQRESDSPIALSQLKTAHPLANTW
jgi:hypothetical protein